MTTHVRVAIGCALVVLAGSKPSRAADSWIEIKSAHFTVLSNASDGTTRTLAWQFEQIRSAVAALWPWARVDFSKPFQIIAVKDENSMKALAPSYWEQRGGIRPASVWVSGADQHYVLLRADIRSEDRDTLNPYTNAYWVYVSTVLQATFGRRLPLWFHIGLSEVMSNTIVRDRFVLLGPIIPWHLRRLNSQARMSVAELVKTTRDSREYKEAERRYLLDAESWAFVHFLVFGEKGAHQKQLARYGGLLREGTDPTPAFKEAFGSIQDYEKPFVDYIRQSIFGYVRVDIDAGVKREDFAVRPVPPAEAAAARAAFHVAMARPAEARAALDEARNADPAAAAPAVAAGLLLQAEGKRNEARAAFGKAVELGTASAYAHYWFARLSWLGDEPDPDTMTKIEKSAARAAALNPRDADAYAYLAEVQAALKRPRDTVAAVIRRAIRLEPKESRHHLTAARVFWRLEMDEDARTAVDTALSLAQDEAERDEAERMMKFLKEAKKPGGKRLD